METNINISRFWPRIWAFCIDGVILALAGLLLGFIFRDFVIRIGAYGPLFGLFITATYQTICNSKIMKGQTLGKNIMNLHVVDIHGNYINPGRSFLRSLILSAPYFIVNLHIPFLSEIAILDTLKILILSSLVIGVVVFYIFNTGTRQSLHDLLTGTYVVTAIRKEEPVSLPIVPKSAFYVFGGCVAVLSGLSIFGLVNLASSAMNDAGTYGITVSENIMRMNLAKSTITTYSTGGNSVTKTYEVKLWISNMPEESLEDNKDVVEIVKTILNNEKDITSFDLISVELITEFNIGIASQTKSKSISKSPGAWKETLGL
jgi:uncharacterized RDD family membrane protein YckC